MEQGDLCKFLPFSHDNNTVDGKFLPYRKSSGSERNADGQEKVLDPLSSRLSRRERQIMDIVFRLGRARRRRFWPESRPPTGDAIRR